jgi:hypothetical protein
MSYHPKNEEIDRMVERPAFGLLVEVRPPRGSDGHGVWSGIIAFKPLDGLVDDPEA